MNARKRPVTLAVVGAGNRSTAYTNYALRHPADLKIVAVADPNPVHRKILAEKHRIPPALQFSSHRDLAARPGLADVVLNATRDRDHFPTAKPLLEAGYHMLLEKPIVLNERHLRELVALAKRRRRTVMICHVLRYAPFYSTIRQMILDGEIGEVVSLRTLEAVSYHHMATGFVRDRWNRAAESGPMMLTKCCHDLDIIAWMMSGIRVARVASFGSLKQFRPENAPKGSARRCLKGCRIERKCPYSAKRLYLEKGRWPGKVWQPLLGLPRVTRAAKLAHLRDASPYGACVWHSDNDVVDHQSVIMEFANGATATHDMFCATSRPTRQIHVVGTRGEIEADMAAHLVTLRHPTLGGTDADCTEKVVNIREKMGGDESGHGGGDSRLMADLVAVMRGESASISTTRIEDSVTSHLVAFAADRAMRQRRSVEIPRY
jgi:predicted dehydrogenase